MAQRSIRWMGVVAASVILTSLISLPGTLASTQEVSGSMQIFHLDRNPMNLAFSALNPPPVSVPSGLIEMDGKASRSFLNEIDRGLARISGNVLRALRNAGYHVAISESLVDAVPAARNQQVRGYQAHSTWDTVYGMFNRTTKRVVMAEKALQPDGFGMSMQPLRDTARREGIIKHEVGHAVDQYLGNVSHTREFIAAYDKGVRSISAYEAKVLNYYLQQGDAGREETFAEIFASLNGDACDRNSDILLKNHFPELVQLIRSKVQKIAA